MYPVSQAYRTAIDSGAVQHIRCTIAAGSTKLRFGYGYDDGDLIGSPSIDRQCVDNPEVYAFGQLYVGAAEVVVSIDDVDESIFEGGELSLSFGVDISGSDDPEWVPLGVWDISEAVCEAISGTVKRIRIRGLDHLNRLKVEPSYKGVGALFLDDIMEMVEEETGVQFAQTDLEIRTLIGDRAPKSPGTVVKAKMAPTFWDEIAYIAQLIGGWAIADRQGKILFRKPEQTAVLTIPANKRFTAQISEKNYAPYFFRYSTEGFTRQLLGLGAETGSELSFSDNGYIYGLDEGNYVNIIDSWLVPIVHKYPGIKWYPGTISWYGDPALDLGDTVILIDGVAGETPKKFLICAESWKFRSPQTLISGGAPKSTDTASSSSSGSGGSSASYVPTARPKTINAVELDKLPGDLYAAERTIANGGYSGGSDGYKFVHFNVNLQGSETGEVSAKVYHDEIAQDFLPRISLVADGYATLSFSVPISSAAGTHTLRLAATGEAAEVVDVEAYVWGQELSATSPEYVSARFFTYIVEDGKAVVTGYTGSSLYPEIPPRLGGYPVTAIGEEAFTDSNITAVYIPEGVTEIRSRNLLPEEYQQVEYLESTGTQYIDLGDLATDNYVGITIDFSISEIVNDTWIAGNGNSWYSYQKGLGMTSSELRKPDANTTYTPDTLQAGLRIVGTFKTNESYQHVYAFASSGSYGAVVGNAKCRIYEISTDEQTSSFQPMSGGEAHHFYPCYRKADNVPGFYDIEHNVFYTNSGTGDFICGPNGGPGGTGAFMNAHDLATVYIPRTCESIGEWAFTNTALKKARIPEDCEYYDTSFPSGCEVEFYGGGGDYGQLYDSEDYALVDADGARLYV